MQRSLNILGAVILSVGIITIANADTMQSSNYILVQDSVNAGGLFSSSTSYRMEDTVGEQGVGRSGSTNFNIKAGYQQMQEVGLALTGAVNVTLSPALEETGGGSSTGSLALTAITDNQTGYQLSIAVSNNPAMQSNTATIANYTPAGANPDFTFSVLSSDAMFGFSPEGTHITNEYKDNGTTCNTGALDTTNACWNALTTTDEVIATSGVANNPSGTVTTLKFRVEAGATAVLTPGSYVATTTVTLVAQ